LLPLLPSPTALVFASLSLAALLCAPPARADGPVIELAPQDRDPPPKAPPVVSFGAGRAPEPELVRGLTEQRFRSALESLAHTSVGGYGELFVTGSTAGPGAPRQWTADARRVVLFVAHSFTRDIRAYTEIEIEHASGAEIEQAYVDWKVAGDYLGLRAGLVLVPMGIVNEAHEPPVFNGVQRPSVETVIIPSTWRELGAGFFGRPTEILRYQLYAVTGLDPLGYDAGGFVNARGGAEQAKAKAWAVAARVEVEPLLGVVLGASLYAGDNGKNGDFHLRDRSPVTLGLPIAGYSVDARLRRAGLECKILYTEWHLGGSGALMRAYDANGNPLFADPTKPVPSLMRGAYAEAGYDVLHPAGLSHQLVPFVRFEAYDTQSAVPQGFAANTTYDIREVTVGASYRPIREVVLKGDYQLRYRQSGPNETQINAGIGFMY
jgi:hypothetical protein